MKKTFILFALALALAPVVSAQEEDADYWSISGNSNTSSSHYIGTTRNVPVQVKSQDATLTVGESSNTQFLLHSSKAVESSLPPDAEINSIPTFLFNSANVVRFTNRNTNNGFAINQSNWYITLEQRENADFHIKGIGGGLTIKPDGRIGIGTFNPTAKLSVDGDATTSGNLTVGGNLTSPSQQLSIAGSATTSGNLTVGGNLTGPNQQLSIAGDASASGSFAAGGSLYVGTTNTPKGVSVGALSGIAGGLSYIGFNLKQVSANEWSSRSNVSNGGCAILAYSNGDMAFVTKPQGAPSHSGDFTNEDILSSTNMILHANGQLQVKEVKVTHSNWPDFVFESDYSLPSLKETEQYIRENGHLPSIPSAVEVEADGVNLGEMNALLLQKVEELTLYVIELQKQINELKGE